MSRSVPAEGRAVGVNGRSVVRGSAIPDTSMFQSPIYQWAGPAIDVADGSSPVDWPESIGDLSDATAVNSPTKTTQNEFEAVDYDAANSDGHNWTADSQLPTGADPFSLAATLYLPSVPDSARTIISWGTASDDQINGFGFSSNGEVFAYFFGNDLSGNTTVSSDVFITIGVRYDGSGRKIYLNGSGDGFDSPGSVNVQDANHSLGYEAARGSQHTDAIIHDMVVSDVAESDQAFSDYHSTRLG